MRGNRGRNMKFGAATVLLLIGAVAAGPLAARDKCAEICDTAQTKYRYEPGKTYSYDFEGTTLTRVEGASEEHSGLHVKTNARINVISPCELSLELRGTELFHLDPRDVAQTTPSPVGGSFKAALEAKELRFGMNNGKIDRVCGSGQRDPAWVINVKRAIISNLQNAMTSLERETTVRESDVMGTCDTTYKIEDDTIVKTKNLLGCVDREYINTMIQHDHYMVPSDIQGLPILKSNHTCRQIIKDGLVQDVECSEKHVARPFSNGESGAATTLRSKLTLKNVLSEVKSLHHLDFKAPLTFNMTKTQRELQNAENDVKKAIAEICEADLAEDKSPERFAKMIKTVQTMDEATLVRVHRHVRGRSVCRLGRKTFHDVLPLAGTTAAVSIMKDVLLAGEVDGVEKEMWKSALAFIPRPNAEMIAHVTPLLRKPDRKIYLSTSALVKNFCSKNEKCEEVKEVQDFVKVLEANIGTNCDGKDKDVVMMSLKGLGNVGVALTARDSLIRCVKNERISMDLRVNALEAFRNMKLKSAKPELIEIYKDMEQDPEIRIGAFVALMRDPCKMCIEAVEETMQKEKMLQVGSFVMSYMENARRAENPVKKELNDVLKTFDESKITQDWNLERMKYSRAYQASYFSPLVNAGIDAESHVIFSPAGFLPRQVKTDLNVNLFGRSINIMEVGARMEGLENLLEYYFGPSGTLKDTGVGRTKRAALEHDRINEIHDKVNSQQAMKEAHGYMYLKAFGSELGYSDFDLASILDKKDNINVLELLRAIAKNHETEYTQNFQLMDLTYNIPTILGLPLKLDFSAHGILHLKVGGKFDIVKFMQPPRSLDIDGHIKPSASIEVKTGMGIDAFFTQTGINMVANLHTSTSMQGKIILKDGKIFKVHYSVPKHEQEIFHGQTKFFVKHHETDREQRMITQDAMSKKKCTSDKMATITGLEMCGEMRFPNASMKQDAPYFPLTGPVNMRLAISKRDSQLTSYDFEASRTSVYGVETMKLIFDTPKSEINRELSMVFLINTNEKAIDFNLKSPWKKMNAVASLVNNDDLKKVNAKLVIDEEREYSANALVQIQRQGDTVKYLPGLDIKMNGETPLILKGLVTVDKNKKIEVDVNVEKLTTEPITLKGSLERVDNAQQLRINHDLLFTSPLFTVKTNGFMEQKNVKFTIRSENSFKFRQGKEHKMIFNSKLHSEKKRNDRIFNLQSTLSLNDFPDHNLGLDIDFKKTDTNTKFNVETRFRKDIEPVKFTNDFTYKLSRPIKLTLKSELSVPSRKIALTNELTEDPEGTFKSSSLFTWAPGKEIKAEFTIINAAEQDDIVKASITGHLEAPFMPTTDIIIKPTLNKKEAGLFLEAKYDSNTHSFEARIVREQSSLNALWKLTLNQEKYEVNLKGRRIPNLVEFHAKTDLNGRLFELNFNGATQKTALKIHSDMNILNTKYELNLNGEMTGEAIKAHGDLAIAGKKMDVNLDYLRNGFNVKVLVNGNGLNAFNSQVSSVSFKLHNELTGEDLTSLIEIKADSKAIMLLALKGTKTRDSFTGNLKITAPRVTATGDLEFKFRERTYSLISTLELPQRTVGFQVRSAGDRNIGHVNIEVDINKKEQGNIFSYELSWSNAAPRDRKQFFGELTMKQPQWLFPVPIKMSTLLSKDIRGTYTANLVLDYSLKFELKAIHKVMRGGYQTNIDISTPIEGLEKMSAELVAMLDESGLTFKIAALYNEEAIEFKLVGKSILEARQTHIEGELSLKTPFKQVEVITAAFKHKVNGYDITTSSELKWGINKKVAFIFENKFDNADKLNGRLTIITPVTDYETFTLEYDIKSQGDKTTGLAKFVWASKPIFVWTTDYTRKPDISYGFDLQSILKITGYEDTKLIVEMLHKPMISFDLTAEGSYGSTKITFLTKAEKTQTKNEAVIALKTPSNPEGYSVKLLFNDPNQGTNLDVKLILTGKPDEVITLSGYLKKQDWKRVEGKMELTTPFSDKVAGDFGWHLSKSEGIYKTNFALEYQPGQKITFEEDLLVNLPNVEFTVKATSPIDPLRLIRYHVKSTGNLDNLNTHIERQINDMQVTTEILAKLISVNDFELTLTTSSPIRKYENTEIKISNKGEINNMVTKASLLLAGKTWALDTKTAYNRITDMKIELNIQTPLSKLEKITIGLVHKGSLDNMLSTMKVNLPVMQKPLDLEWSMKYIKFTNMEAKLSIKNFFDLFTEAEGAETVTFSFSNRGENMRPLLTILSTTIGPKVYSLTSTLNYEDLTNMDGSIILTTPIPNYERVGLSWENKITGNLKEAKLTVEFQTDQKIVTSGFIKRTGQKLETKLTITTPLQAFDKAEFAFDFDGTPEDFKSKLSVILPKVRETQIHFDHKLDLSTGIKQEGLLRIDCIFFSTTSLKTSFELTNEKIDLVADFGYGLKKGKFITNMKRIVNANDATYDLKTSLKTDWTEFKSGELIVKLAQGPGRYQYKFDVTTKYNDEVILTMTQEHVHTQKGFVHNCGMTQNLFPDFPKEYEGKIEVEIDFRKSLIKYHNLVDKKPFMGLDFTHTLETDTLLATLSVHYKDLKTEGNIMLSKPKSTYTIHLDVTHGSNKLVDFDTEYKLQQDESHALKIKAVVEGKTWLDIEVGVKPNPSDAGINIRNDGRLILGWTGALKGQDIETKLIWKEEPLFDSKVTFTFEPLVFNAEMKFKGEVIFTTENKLDIRAKTLDVMIDFDPILMKLVPGSESAKLIANGKVTERRNALVLEIELKKGTKTMKLETTITKTGSLDLTFRPAQLQIDLKVGTNFNPDGDFGVVLKMNKNSGLVRTSLIVAVKDSKEFQTGFELKTVQNQVTTRLELIIPSKDINSALILTYDQKDTTSYGIKLIGDLNKPADSSVSLSGDYLFESNGVVFNVETEIPTRKMTYKFSHLRKRNAAHHDMEFSWVAGKTVGYNFVLTDRSRRRELNFNLDGGIKTPIREMKYNVKLEMTQRKYGLEINVLPDAKEPERKTSFKININNESYGEMFHVKSETTFSHPSLEKPVELKGSLTLNRGKIMIAGNLDLDYSKNSRKKISVNARLTDDSEGYPHRKHTLVAELKQPANFVDVRSTYVYEANLEEATLNNTLSYLTSKREIKTLESSIMIHVPSKKIQLRMKTPSVDRKLFAQLVDDSSVEGRQARLVVRHEDVMKNEINVLLDVEIDERSRSFRLQVLRLLKINSNIHDEYMLHLTALTGDDDRKLFLLKTNFKDATRMLINTRVEWDPEVVRVIKDKVPPMVAKIGEQLADTWGPCLKELLEDLQTKLEASEEVILREIRPLIEAWRRYLTQVNEELRAAREHLQEMIMKNEFYLRDAKNAAKDVYEVIRYYLAEVEKTLWTIHARVMEHVERGHSYLLDRLRGMGKLTQRRWNNLKNEYREFRRQVERLIDEIKPVVEEAVRDLIDVTEKTLRQLYKDLKPKIDALRELSQMSWEDLMENVIKPLEKRLREILETLEENFEPYLERIQAILHRVKDKAIEIYEAGLDETLEELKDRLEKQYAQTSADIVAFLEELNQKIEEKIREYETYPKVKEMKECFDKMKAKLIWSWNYLDIPSEIQRVLREMRERRETFWRIIRENRSRIVVDDRSNGIFEFDLEFPIALKDLARIPTFDALIERLSLVRRELSAAVPKISWTLRDYYYYYRPSRPLRHMLPPFRATGIVAGNQHYYTFDGSYYEFAGDCSYVLARDFKDGNFTVIVNYRRTRAGPRRQSISVITGGKTVEIFNTFKTVVDKTNVELPVQYADTWIQRLSENQVHITSEKGISVTCHMDSDICTVSMSGWYFGKTGGLLGTYDYEPSTDMTNPMGQPVEDVERFANSWEVAKTCYDKTNYAKAFDKIRDIETTPAYRVCERLFMEDSSPLRPAFRVVNASAFMSMCINDVFGFQNHPDAEKLMKEKACTSVAAYRTEAMLRGIFLRVADECTSCETSTGEKLRIGEEEKLTNPMMGVDTVVVFEENICNKNRRKDLLGMISNIERAYLAKGLKENRYGLAAFGGQGVHEKPHFHTIEGKLLNSDRKFVRGVRSLEFDDKAPTADVEAAIAFAARRYPWRPEVRRNIILVSCSRCSERQRPVNVYWQDRVVKQIDDLTQELNRRGIRLHLLRDESMEFRGGKKASNVLGFDKDGVFITKDTTVADLEGDAGLLAQLRVPKEGCIETAQETEGSYFTINSFSTGRLRDQKKFLDVFSRRVAKNSVPESCQICECKLMCPYTRKTASVCRPCNYY